MNFLLLLLVAWAAARAGDMYAADPNVYELTPATFNKVVKHSNYTTMVKFYAPWCGYCQQLHPIYQKIAKFVHRDAKYAVNIASVNCDRDENKALCAQHKISGFPTIKVFRPPKHKPGKRGSHVPELYHGERALMPMVDFVTNRIKNYVIRYPSFNQRFTQWLLELPAHKVVLLNAQTLVSPMFKLMAVDFLGSAELVQVTVKEPSPTTITVDGHDVEVPMQLGDALPILLVFKDGQFVRYPSDKFTNKNKLEKWVIKETGAEAAEGAFSKKEKAFAKYRGAKKGKTSDEL